LNTSTSDITNSLLSFRDADAGQGIGFRG